MRPVKELKGYLRIALAAGEKKHAMISVGKEAFCFLNAGMEYGMFDGDYTVSVGTSSEKIVGTFEVRVRNGKTEQV